MPFLPLHRDKEHEFKKGYWAWVHDELKFHPHGGNNNTKGCPCSFDTGLKFALNLDVAGEKDFLEVFQRRSSFGESEVVTIQDVKNLALFLLKSKVQRKFIEFVYDKFEKFDKFLHSVVFYIELFLKVLELLLIRRDHERSGEVRDALSIEVEQLLAKQLSDRRTLVAREYSPVSALLYLFLNSFDHFLSDIDDI